MSKKNQNKKDVFMEIINKKENTTYMLKVPESFRFVLDDLMATEKESIDFHNSKQMLQFFCELFSSASHKKRSAFEIIINNPSVEVQKLTDLITVFMNLHKYYVLKVSSNRELGEFHIMSARSTDPDSWIAKSDLKDARNVAKKIKNIENGCIHNGFYVGQCYMFVEQDD